MKRWKIPAALMAAALVVGGCSGTVGAPDTSFSDSAPEAIFDEGASAMDSAGAPLGVEGRAYSQEGPGDTAVAEDPASEEKAIIKRANLSLEVEDVEDKLAEVLTKTRGHGGEVTYYNSKVRGRELSVNSTSGNAYQPPIDVYNPIVGDYAFITLEVPADHLEVLLADLKKVGKVVIDNLSTDDVTLEVNGLQARIESQTESLETIEGLLEEATSIDDVIKIENTIASRRSELASLQAQLNSLNKQVAKSSVTVQLVTEVANEPTREERGWWGNLWHDVQEGVGTTFAGMIVLLASIAPIAILGGLALGVFLWVRRLFRSRKKTN